MNLPRLINNNLPTINNNLPITNKNLPITNNNNNLTTNTNLPHSTTPNNPNKRTRTQHNESYKRTRDTTELHHPNNNTLHALTVYQDNYEKDSLNSSGTYRLKTNKDHYDTDSITSSISSDSDDATDDDIAPVDNSPPPNPTNGINYTKKPVYLGADANYEENVDDGSEEEGTEEDVPPYPNPTANGTPNPSPQTQTALNDNNESKSNTNYNNKKQQISYQPNNTQKSEQVKPSLDETNPKK